MFSSQIEKSILTVFTILVLTAITTVRCQDPTVNITSTNPPTIFPYKLIQAPQDNDVTIDCYVENRPVDVLVRWQKTFFDANGQLHTVPISTDLGVEDNTKYGIEQPTYQTWRLRIRYIQIADEGNYTCYCPTSAWGKILKFDNRTVVVVVSPFIDQQWTSSDTTVNQGDSADLMCNASGRPQPLIEWSRMGGALLPTGQELVRGSLLGLKNIMSSARGQYRCTAFNSVGTVVYTISLNVNFPPTITVGHTTVNQAVGYVIELQCYVAANPLPNTNQVYWVKDSATFTQAGGRVYVNRVIGAFQQMTLELIFRGVRPSDYGVYQCMASNSQGSASQSVTLAPSNQPMPSYKRGRVIASASTAKYSWLLLFLLSSAASMVLQL